MYELLTGGERPFTGEHATITGTIGEKVRWEQRKLAPPSPRTHNPQIPPAVEDVVLRCLAKDRKKRYPSVNSLLEALNQAVGAESEALPTLVFNREEVLADAHPPAGRKKIAANPVYYVGAIVVGIGLLLGGGLMIGTGNGRGESQYAGNPSPVVITSIVEVEVTSAVQEIVQAEPTRILPTNTPQPTPIPALSVRSEWNSGQYFYISGGPENYNTQCGPFPAGDYEEGPNDKFLIHVDINGDVWGCRYSDGYSWHEENLKKKLNALIFGETPRYDLSIISDDNGTYSVVVYETNFSQKIQVWLSRDYTK